MISSKGCHLPKGAVLYAFYFYLRYTVSYRDMEEIMVERGASVDRVTLNRWAWSGLHATCGPVKLSMFRTG